MSNDTIFIKPAPGLIVKDPLTGKPLPEEGATKPRDTYWLRRQAEGDVIEAQPPKQKKETTE